MLPRSSVRPTDQVPTSDHTLSSAHVCVLSVAGLTHVIELPSEGTLVIGRGSEADLWVVADGVSRQHCQLTIDRETMTVTDLGSRNGSYVGGARITGPTLLDRQRELRVGEVRLMVTRRDEKLATRGLWLRAPFDHRLRIEVARAHAFGRPLALLLARFERPCLELPLVTALAAELRPIDVLGLFDDATVQLILPDGSDVLRESVQRSLRDLASKHATHVQLALAPLTAGSSAEQLKEQVTRALGVEPSQKVDRRSDDAIVKDPQMQRIYEEVRRVAKGNVSVLVVGETGAGKELVAKALHKESGRRGKLVALNASALPEALLESELFGHERGAFTGANGKPGLFEAAHGGTLFLDEIADLPMNMQAKLLRVLEDGVVRRVGANNDRKVDVRVVAATNADLPARCRDRLFRSDLMFRLNACTFHLPPLRSRPLDLLALAEHFLARAARGRPLRLAPEALHAMAGYDWPGNVRELRNVVERAALLCEAVDGTVRPELLGELGRAPEFPSAAERPSALPTNADVRADVRDFERDRVERALAAADGNLTRAAEMLGLPRKTLAYRVEKLGLSTRRR